MNNERLGLPQTKEPPSNIPSFMRFKSPGLAVMGADLIESGKRVIESYRKTGQILATEEKATKRLEICKGCVFFENTMQTCIKCGCFMVPKTHLEGMKCPMDKW
jgi:hypothetical protein